MSTRQQIRDELLFLLRETTSDTNFTQDQLNAVIDSSVKYLAVLLEHPRDMIEIQADSASDTYQLPSDNLYIRYCWFGDKNIRNDVKRLQIISLDTLSYLYPSWLDDSSGARGRPQYLIMMDKKTVYVHPRPDSTHGATGKKLIIQYVFIPNSMNSDSDEPEIPLIYHTLVKFHSAYVCYLNLGNRDQASIMMQSLDKHMLKIESQSTKETQEGLSFQWGFDEDINDLHVQGSGVIP